MTDSSKLPNRSMYHFLMALTISSSLGLQAWRTLFDNFAVKVVGLDGSHIGVIQSIREIPGFLALLVIFVMLLLNEHRISSLSIITLGIGVGITGLFPSYLGLIGTTIIMSLGFHYYETTFQSLTLQYFDKKTSPLIFGRMRSVGAASNIAVGSLIFLLVSYLTFAQLYLAIGVLILIIGMWSFNQNPVSPNIVTQRKRMILRKRYWLYYFLTFMAGARRQIFVAFALFLLVKKFEFNVQEITILFIINNAINYFLSPLIGKAVVRFGERKVLSVEYFSLIFVFLAYAVVETKLLVALLYIIDHILFNFAMAIRTFFQKIGDPRDIAPSMAVGFTINHTGAVIFPVMGGLLWMIDYRIPFVVGSVLSVISLSAVQLITGQVKRADRRGD
ncbi:MAG: MFS transporter [candidate division Zixibacteria bacterium]|nr:MFS transporter [candidate division Zixibacteria bacterium]